MNHYQLTRKSKNKKVGAIPTTNSPRSTCPPNCKLRRGPCYAESGFHTRLNWDKLDAEERGVAWPEFVKAIAKLPKGQLWRHNVAGDLPGANDVIDSKMLGELVDANKGKRGFTYTHYPVDFANKSLLHWANQQGFTINVSTDTVEEAAQTALDNPTLPVVTLLPRSAGDWRRVDTKAGPVVRCPAEYMDTSCKECKLCAASNRGVIVGFTSHGTKAAQADIIASSN